MPRAVNTEMVKVAAVARFLGKKPEEVVRMIGEDRLPHSKLPGENKPSFRIFLPDFHAWLLPKSGTSPKLLQYAEFKKAFFEAQKAVREKTNH